MDAFVRKKKRDFVTIIDKKVIENVDFRVDALDFV